MVAKYAPATDYTRRRPKATPALNPTHLKQTILKMDRCVARLQQLRSTASPSSSSSSSSSLRGENESPKGSKLPDKKNTSQLEWRQASLQAMIVVETMAEITRASAFTREAAASSTNAEKINSVSKIRPQSRRTENKEAAVASRMAWPSQPAPWRKVERSVRWKELGVGEERRGWGEEGRGRGRSHLFLVKRQQQQSVSPKRKEGMSSCRRRRSFSPARMVGRVVSHLSHTFYS